MYLPALLDNLRRLHGVHDSLYLCTRLFQSQPGGCNTGERIIFRLHFSVLANDIVDGKCRFCGHPIAGIWAGS